MFGAIVGSFLATVALRWPEGRSAMHGRSACDGCGRTLGPRDLVPLVSWAMQAGRCRACGARIHPLHPGLEAASAAVGGLCLLVSPGPGGAALALLGWMVLLAAVLDARHLWLPHALSAMIAAAGLALGGVAMRAVGIDASFHDRAIGAGAALLALIAIGALYRLARGRDGLGGGDAPFLAALAAWTGWQLLPMLLLFAGLAGIAIACARGPRRDAALPFGTLLALALPFALGAAPWLIGGV